ncbi:MAG TPA: hypothetical protein VK081_03095 [Planctomycetota bacterium]|nr:hypothetical protein [Planctomycetota bacterium]
MISAHDALRHPIPLPGAGDTVRHERGRLQLLLEHRRGGYVLVSHDGVTSRRYWLGLPANGTLELRVRPPDHRVHVQVQDMLCLAPGGRLRGYVAVPVQHRLVWVQRDGRCHALVDLPAADLQTVWLGEGEAGGYAHQTASPFLADRRAGVDPELRCLVPVLLHNDSDGVVRPPHLAITLRERDLHSTSGRLVAAPRRIVFRAEDRQHERVRPFRAAPPAAVEVGA